MLEAPRYFVFDAYHLLVFIALLLQASQVQTFQLKNVLLNSALPRSAEEYVSTSLYTARCGGLTNSEKISCLYFCYFFFFFFPVRA